MTTNSKLHLAQHTLDQPVSLYHLLSQCKILETATHEQIRELAAYTVCPPHKRELEAYLEKEPYEKEILKKSITMLDLLEKYEACQLPIERFLELSSPLIPKYHLLSSSLK